jgi:hypothetical protein
MRISGMSRGAMGELLHWEMDNRFGAGRCLGVMSQLAIKYSNHRGEVTERVAHRFQIGATHPAQTFLSVEKTS